MEPLRKAKTDKHVKHEDKEKPSSIVTDIKTIRENLKIKEILRTVKMNSSMRIKAPRGSKVMQSKDFSDEHVDENNTSHIDGRKEEIELEANHATDINTDVSEISNNEEDTKSNNDIQHNAEGRNDRDDQDQSNEFHETTNQSSIIIGVIPEAQAELHNQVPKIDFNDQKDLINDKRLVEYENIKPPEEIIEDTSENQDVVKRVLTRNDSTLLRDRKLSLDQTFLTRREGLSQSEFDLHTMGKSPLERKSSFFRKKMDNFLKNTTEIFRRHSSHYKVQPGVQRRGSVSVSLQSLHEDSSVEGNLGGSRDIATLNSVSSLQSSSSLGLSGSNLSVVEQDSSGLREMTSSQPALCASQPIIGSREHINSLSVEYPQESLLNSRAISMSSGLVSSLERRWNTRSKRVTWLGSEGLNYLRRQDELKSNMQSTHSFMDLRSMKGSDPQLNRVDTKGRRLSYQRAVSGEDPVRPKYNLLWKKTSTETQNSDILEYLDRFSLGGFEHVRGYKPPRLSDEAYMFLQWAEVPDAVEIFFDWKFRGAIGPPPPTFVEGLDTKDFFHKPYQTPLTKAEDDRQAVIRELFVTEAYYIRHLSAVVEVFIGSAHLLQDSGQLTNIDTEKLFVNFPDLLNASLLFWEQTFVPMLIDGVENNVPFNLNYMEPGFSRFKELFLPYERYVASQSRAVDYLRVLVPHTEFMLYLDWCHKQKSCKRFQLADILVTPMQRVTKYGLILRRIISLTDFEPERSSLVKMDSIVAHYVLELNRSIRQREELDILDRLCVIIDAYEIEFKDEDLDRAFRMESQLNLRAPMMFSMRDHSRSLVHEGDYKFKDNVKELEVHIFIFTDLMLICKKYVKNNFLWKVIRPKIMLKKLMTFEKGGKNSPDLQALVFIYLDEVGSSTYGFILTEIKEKEPNHKNSLRLFRQKCQEAVESYDLGVLYAQNPSYIIEELDSTSDYASNSKQNSELLHIRRESRKRVAAMLHGHMSVSTEYDCSQGSMATDSCDADVAHANGACQMHERRHPMLKSSTCSSRQSRLSSFQQSTSASHDELQPGPSCVRNYHRAGTSVEHQIPVMKPDDGSAMTLITVKFEGDSESEESNVGLAPPPPPSPETLNSPTRNTLRVQPTSGVMALVHSLPDLSLQPHCPGQFGQRHHHHHHHHRHLSQQPCQSPHHLQPDHRGISYPPPSPTRASLQRGLAFSYAKPPLSKMGRVSSQASQAPRQVPREAPRACPKETPRDAPRQGPREAPRQGPREAQRDVPQDAPRDVHQERPLPHRNERSAGSSNTQQRPVRPRPSRQLQSHRSRRERVDDSLE